MEETQEIIYRAADPFEKWALLIFLFILMVIVGGTSFVNYPEIVEGEALLTGRNAPNEIVTQQGGRLVALFLENNQRAKANQIIRQGRLS
jgi:multidrug efflux pump subunit AcrA (membrane-fusion protein)